MHFYCGHHFFQGIPTYGVLPYTMIPPRNFGWVGNYLTCTELNHLALLITRVQTYLHVSTHSNLLKPSKQHFKGLAFSGIHSYSYPTVWGCTIFARFTLPFWRRVRVRDYLHLCNRHLSGIKWLMKSSRFLGEFNWINHKTYVSATSLCISSNECLTCTLQSSMTYQVLRGL